MGSSVLPERGLAWVGCAGLERSVLVGVEVRAVGSLEAETGWLAELDVEATGVVGVHGNGPVVRYSPVFAIIACKEEKHKNFVVFTSDKAST